MKILLTCALALSLLTGCTASEIVATAQGVKADAQQFRQETIERRRELRKARYELEDEVLLECRNRARAMNTISSAEEALDTLEWCLDFIEQVYPELPSLQALDKIKERLGDE